MSDYRTFVKCYRRAADQGHDGARSDLSELKSRLASKEMNDCLFEYIKKITSEEAKTSVKKYCRNKWGKNPLDWLLRKNG